MPASRRSRAAVFLVLGVLESGRGKAGTGHGGPPLRDLEVSQRWEPTCMKVGEDRSLRGRSSHSEMGAYRARLKMAPGSGIGKNDGSDICSMVS